MLRSTFFRRFLVFFLLVGLALSTQPGLMQADTTAYSSEDGSISFSYPSDWIYDDSVSSFGIILANNQDTLDSVQSEDGTLPEEGIIVMVSPSARNFINLDDDEYEQMSPLELAEALGKDLVKSASDNSSYEPPEAVTISGHDSASLVAVNGEIDADALIYVIDMGSEKAAIVAYSYQGDMFMYARAIRALADSLEIEAAAPATPTRITVAGQLTYDESVDGEVTDTENSVWTFEGEEGDAVTLTVSGGDLDTELVLLDPSGEELARDDDTGIDYNPLLVAVELPEDGVYTVEVNSIGGGEGPFSLLMEKAVIVPPQPIEYGESVTGELTQPQGDRWSFSGEKGDIVQVTLTADYDNLLELRDSANEILIQDDDSGGSGNAAIAGFPLPEDGDYMIFVRAYDASYATDTPYTLSFDKITVPLPGEIAYGTFVTTVLLSTEGDRWTFEGQDGDKVGIAVIGTIMPMVELHGPDGDVIASNENELGANSSLIDGAELPDDGEYAIVIQSYSGSTGKYTLILGQVTDTEENGNPRPRGR